MVHGNYVACFILCIGVCVDIVNGFCYYILRIHPPSDLLTLLHVRGRLTGAPCQLNLIFSLTWS